MLFDFAKISTQNVYKLLSFTVVPRPIAWVVSLAADGTRNAAPFSFFNVVATDPPVIALGFTSGTPGGKDSARNIIDTGEFVVNLVPNKLVHEMNLTAVQFDPAVDELTEAGLSVLPSSFVKPPRIAESPVALECERYHVHSYPSGQHTVLGRVLALHVADEAVIDAERCYVDTPKLDLVGRLNNRYLLTTGGFDLPRLTLEDWLAGRTQP